MLVKRLDNIIKFGRCNIHPTVQICSGAIIGKPYRKLLDGDQERPSTTTIEADSYIGYYAIIGAGSVIGQKTIIDDHCIIESRVKLAKSNLVIYRAQICNDVQIAEQCVIGGIVGERTRVGKSCRIFGKIVHLQHNPSLGWDDDDAMEESPTIRDFAFVGFNSIVAGNVTVGRKAYICAGAIITKDVPDLHIAFGINKIVPFSKWNGRLRKSKFFSEDYD